MGGEINKGGRGGDGGEVQRNEKVMCWYGKQGADEREGEEKSEEKGRQGQEENLGGR